MAQAKPKANSIITHVLNEDGTITFNVLGVDSLVFDPEKASPACRRRAEIHGWIQRISDAAAIGVTDSEGSVIPKDRRNQMKYHAMNEVIVHYESGTAEWTRTGSGGGARSITVEAIARHLECEYEEAVEKVERFAEKKGIDTKKALGIFRQNAEVQRHMRDIRDERMPKANVDADAALDELKAA